MSERYELISKKSVTDADGFSTDYAMYFDNETKKYIFMFGDTDYVEPDINYADWECETEKEANEWFSTYSGFEEEDEKLTAIKTESTIEDESEAAWDLLNEGDIIRILILIGSLTHKYDKMSLVNANMNNEIANKLIELANESREEVDNYLNEKPFDVEKLNKSANEIVNLLKNDLTESTSKKVSIGCPECGEINTVYIDENETDNQSTFCAKCDKSFLVKNGKLKSSLNEYIEDYDDYDDDELASIFGGDTDEARKQLIKDMKDEYSDSLEESLIAIDETTSTDVATVKESIEEDVNRRIYTALDNIAFLANEYQDAEEDLGLTNLKQTIEMIEESVDTLKNIINEVIKTR